MISSWVERGRLMASYRGSTALLKVPDGQLVIRDVGPAEYTAFIRDPDAPRHDRRILRREPDFEGWTKLWFVDYDARKSCLEQNPSLLFEADVSPVRRFLTDNNCKLERPKRCYLDLETDSRTPFSVAVTHGTRLLSWAVVDEAGAKWSAVLDQDTDLCEAALWAELWRRLAEFDQVAAWNGDRFDFAVMKLQCERYVKTWPKLLAPYFENRRRVQLVDQMLCFKRHHMAADSGDDKTSMRLDDVCMAIIGEGKHDFASGQTWDAWAGGGASRQSLVNYNIQDTDLLRKLENATGYLELQQTIAEVTLCPVNTHTLKPMPWIDAYLLKMAHRRKTHLRSKFPGEGGHEEVQGAIVTPPTSLGIHQNVHVCDFASLYPTVIRTWNLGNETKLGKQPDGAAEQCLAANDIYFRTDEVSMLSAFCREMMDLRSHWKSEKKRLPPGTPEWKAAERKEKAYKIANNSGFGVTGNPYFRLYDPEITEAIIQGARLLLTATQDAAKTRGLENIYGDTDSAFIKGGTVEEFNAFVAFCNATVYPKVLDARGCRPEHRCIKLAYEKQFAKLVFPLGVKGSPSAKRYLGAYTHYAGTLATADSKPEIRGLEFMRGDSIRLARRLQREAIELILRHDYDAMWFENWIKRKRSEFLEQPVELEDIVQTKGISKPLAFYKSKGPHVRIAEALAEAGEDVGEGTRISYVTIDGRCSPQKVIPASEYCGEFDRRSYWDKLIYPPTLRVLAGAFPIGVNWKRWLAGRPPKVSEGQVSLSW